MSLESWKAEFYPIPASETTEEQAVDHSLQKWLGLLPENLAKHDCHIEDSSVVEIGHTPCLGNHVFIDSSSCSLCHHFCDMSACNSGDDESPCIECPLYKARGDVACDDETSEEWNNSQKSPWHAFTLTFDDYSYDPKPMIHWLKRTQEIEALKPVHERITNTLAKEN